MAEIIIGDHNYQQFLSPPSGQKMGCIPRNYQTHPVGCYASARPFDLPLIPESEWQARLDAKKAANAFLSVVRATALNGGPIPSRDQNGKGYCWAHSSTSAAVLARMVAGQPYADLSAYAVACMIKGFQDQGGWCSESMDFLFTKGIPTSKTWAQQSMSRSNDNANTWAEAAMYKGLEGMDMDPAHMKAQLVTCLLMDIPCATDFNWWSHSVCGCDLVSLNPFQIRIWNSWGDSWSENGMGVLEGTKAIPDAAIALRCTTVAA